MKRKLFPAVLLTCCILWRALCPVAAHPLSNETLSSALLACDTEIDLSAYQISTGEIGRIFTALLHEDPALFHVSPTLSYRYDSLGRILTVYPTYTVTGDALLSARQLYETAVAQLCAEIDPAWSEADKVLYLHGVLARQFTYDLQETNYDAYTFFRDRRGVCQAYALAFSAVARQAGLSVDLVYSDTMDHAWNHVRVDGEWYHVDITRDDPTDGDSPVVLHQRLLRSDAGMTSLGYRDFTCAGHHACRSNRFETTAGQGIFDAWQAVPMYVNGAWCFLSPDSHISPVTLSPDAVTHRQGDVTRDGQITPDDLLILRKSTVEAPLPDEVLSRLRQAILDNTVP